MTSLFRPGEPGRWRVELIDDPLDHCVIRALLVSLPLAAFSAAPKAKVATFQDSAQAQIRCPQDVIVWFNPRKKVWYGPKSRHFANDGVGGFACRGDVLKAGYKQGRE